MESTNKELRSFGLLVGGVFAGVGLWPLVVHAAAPRGWAMIAAALLIVSGLCFPQRLSWLHRKWMAAGHVLGAINTRILLGLIFYLVVTPIGLFRRLLGKDPMGIRLSGHPQSYRSRRKPRPASHLRRQY